MSPQSLPPLFTGDPPAARARLRVLLPAEPTP